MSRGTTAPGSCPLILDTCNWDLAEPGGQESWKTMVNKHYPAQFKADAVALYRSRPGTTIAQIADDLGVNRETLRSWVRADDQRRSAGGPSAGSARPAQAAPASVEDDN